MEVLALLSFAIVILVVPALLALAKPDPAEGAAPSREGRLWALTALVLLAIYATLGPAQLLAEALRERNLLRLTLGAVFGPIGVVLLVQWIRTRPGAREVGMALGIAAVYLMVVLRVGSLEERTHLFEYGLVALLIHQALLERKRHGREVPAPAVLAFVAAALLGWLDEGIQFLLPNRVYDWVDVGFNALAAFMLIAASSLLGWARRRDWHRKRAT